MNYGFIPSKLDGTELEFNEQKEMKIPETYSYKKYLPSVINQGNRPICVPCSISAYINWDENLEKGVTKTDNKVNLNEIYKNRTNDSDDGMSFKDALHFLRHTGVDTNGGVYKIKRYAKVGACIILKQALIMNGPCIGGLPVYDSTRDNFWDKYSGDKFQGGHAISIVGYNKEGFIIRNSWGDVFGDDGYTILPYEDFDKFTEIWTMF